MSVKTRRILIWGLLLASLAAGIAYAFRPRPVPVDLARAEVGRLQVTVDEDGEARERDVYTLNAPLGGYLRRIEAEAGDRVQADTTELARIEPAPPEFLDVRAAAEQEEVVEAARAARALAEAEVERAEAELTFATSELDRARRLVRRETISERALDEAERAEKVAHAGLATAKAALTVREHELTQAQSRLLSRPDIDARSASCDCVPVTSPVGGVVLRVYRESEGIVAAGAPLLDIGDPRDLEIVVDLLSEDAVRVEPGQRAIIAGWGGPDLTATVDRVEPFGRTEVSALGIEEQRVDVVLDLVDPPDRWKRLAHGYRVRVRIVLSETEALQLPLGALFRDGDHWAVFLAENGRARLRRVEVGARNDLAVEIRSGLSAGQRVVLYPSRQISDGARIVER
ncbi:HlyD family secretion protein [Tistlia consotensis]|uniref:HlyD family secretion protein n=1 Tax=Tistlia consotensis USBA 355 TaxID=560819 RepID=A0A1Y6C6Z1_9PROT|nr:HlyD family efflux transporter periplasmic adaptor subunit [Tistlia consotensis]SMF48533.1 HlyD family secretion protein [Tistlia consotensis USBA 355]SNR81096.1 HlyD family secretion protein [Tistlia consotensis]